MNEHMSDHVKDEGVNNVAVDKEVEDNKEDNKGVTRDELIEQLEAQVNYFETLPQHEKFSFALNVDLQYFMLIILNILKKG